MKALGTASVVLLAAGMLAGCMENSNPWGTQAQQKPEAKEQPGAPVREGVASKPGEDGTSPAEAGPEDSAALQAVREYLAKLDSASSPDTTSPVGDRAKQVVRSAPGSAVTRAAPPGSPGERAVAPAGPAPATPADEAITRINQPLDVGAAPATAQPSALTGPAPPRVVSISVSEGGGLQVPATAAPTLAANQALDATGTGHPDTLERLVKQAQKELSGDPASVERQWQLSLLQLAAGQETEARSVSPSIPQQPAALIGRLTTAAAAVGRMLVGPSASANDVLTAVDDLRGTLQEAAELSVSTVALCSRVTNYGVYEELAPGALLPNQSNRVIVYWEVGNFASEKDDSGSYRTVLSTRLELFTPEGQSLWAHEEDRIEDLCKQRRHDFFLAKLVTLPPNLGPGEYLLKVTITDQVASKTNEATHRFSVPEAGGGATAAKG